jgi:hypothetical protein
MSILNFAARPWVEFDAANPQHRAWFAEFQRSRSWAKCPVRFTVSGQAGVVHGIIQRKLIEYYTDLEFA